MKYIYCLLVVLFAYSCETKQRNQQPEETTTSGTIRISVDESFQPVIQEQVKVFSSSFPNAHVIAEYKPEAECLRDLQKDSTRMVIISRDLTEEEQKLYHQRLSYWPSFARIADDAVAVVINQNSPDSVFTYAELKAILAGKSTKNYNVVVDGKSSTSTVRFLIDSVLRGEPLSKSITGAKNSEDLINYIANTPNAIGFVGVSWLTNPQNPQQEQAVAKVKMALIECKRCEKDTYARPSQQTIMFRQYPLVRGLYYVVKENWNGLGSGFVNFLSYERGQLIFNRASLVPYKMKFNKRLTNIKETE
jgi:phosphate transport system substrate-binding protein